MFKNILKKQILLLKEDDIKTFALKNNICLSESEIKKLYIYIQNNYELIFSNNDELILNDLKKLLTNENYLKAKPLLFIYKDKYKNYL